MFTFLESQFGEFAKQVLKYTRSKARVIVSQVLQIEIAIFGADSLGETYFDFAGKVEAEAKAELKEEERLAEEEKARDLDLEEDCVENYPTRLELNNWFLEEKNTAHHISTMQIPKATKLLRPKNEGGGINKAIFMQRFSCFEALQRMAERKSFASNTQLFNDKYKHQAVQTQIALDEMRKKGVPVSYVDETVFIKCYDCNGPMRQPICMYDWTHK